MPYRADGEVVVWHGEEVYETTIQTTLKATDA
jgi:hypothetical protein